MQRVTADGLVGASRDEVWELFDDIAGTPRWAPWVREIAYVSGPARVGAVYRARTRILGLPGTAQWEITEYRRPARQVHESAGGALARRRIVTLEGRGSGTNLHVALELRSSLPGPLGWLHERLAGVAEGPAIRGSVGAVKRRFEGRPR